MRPVQPHHQIVGIDQRAILPLQDRGGVADDGDRTDSAQASRKS
jgi:hypothetical protein